MDINRKTAYQALMDIEARNSYSNIAVNHEIIINRPQNKEFVRRLVYGVLENKILLDYVIDALVDRGVDSLKNADKTLLRMGIYQLAKMDSVPEYAAVSETVLLAKRYARGRDGFINAVLRSYINKKYDIKLPDRAEDEVRYLSVKYSFEPWIISLWLETYDVDFVEDLLKASNETPDLTIRMNWLKIMKEDLLRALKSKGYDVTEGTLAADAFHVKGADVIETEYYKSGMFSVQDESSQLAVQMLDPKPGETVFDVCAGTGGKSMAIAERMNNKGLVIASDIYKRKVEMATREAARLGIEIVKPKTWDAMRVDSTLVGKVDKVFCDVPCSGFGVIRRKPEIKYRKETRSIKMLPVKQLAILRAASTYVKPGGTLVYATCTINPYENERVVADFLRKNNAFKVEESKLLLPNVDGCDGFFICKLNKEKNLIDNERAQLV